MEELLKFRIWTVKCGHYATTEAVDRYLEFIGYERADDTSKDTEETVRTESL